MKSAPAGFENPGVKLLTARIFSPSISISALLRGSLDFPSISAPQRIKVRRTPPPLAASADVWAAFKFVVRRTEIKENSENGMRRNAVTAGLQIHRTPPC